MTLQEQFNEKSASVREGWKVLICIERNVSRSENHFVANALGGRAAEALVISGVLPEYPRSARAKVGSDHYHMKGSWGDRQIQPVTLQEWDWWESIKSANRTDYRVGFTEIPTGSTGVAAWKSQENWQKGNRATAQRGHGMD